MPLDFGPKQLKLKGGDVRLRTREGLTTLVWKDRREVYMLTNMDPPPAEGNFCDENNRPVKPHIVERYSWHMGYINNSDHMATSYLMSRCTLKWTTKLFFHHLDLTVLNSWILLSSCGAKYTVCPESKCTDFLFKYLLDLPEITSDLLQSMTLGKIHSGSNVFSTVHSSTGSHFP